MKDHNEENEDQIHQFLYTLETTLTRLSKLCSN
jgi:hypothetical protein